LGAREAIDGNSPIALSLLWRQNPLSATINYNYLIVKSDQYAWPQEYEKPYRRSSFRLTRWSVGVSACSARWRFRGDEKNSATACFVGIPADW